MYENLSQDCATTLIFLSEACRASQSGWTTAPDYEIEPLDKLVSLGLAEKCGPRAWRPSTKGHAAIRDAVI